MPSSVRRRCSVLYVFSPYLLLSLFLSPHRGLSAASILARLVPGLDTVGRSLEARMPLRDDRENEWEPPRVSLLSRREGGREERRG